MKIDTQTSYLVNTNQKNTLSGNSLPALQYGAYRTCCTNCAYCTNYTHCTILYILYSNCKYCTVLCAPDCGHFVPGFSPTGIRRLFELAMFLNSRLMSNSHLLRIINGHAAVTNPSDSLTACFEDPLVQLHVVNSLVERHSAEKAEAKNCG